MASWFEFRLVGQDEEHLRSVGEAMLDEVQRVERLLSRFDPTGSLARVNREARERPVRVERELLAVLKDCLYWHRRTGGWFNPCRGRDGVAVGRLEEVVGLDDEAGAVVWLDRRFEIDLGGYGKGYALDRAARMLEGFGIESALMEGGTSSVLARGRSWVVAVRDPVDPEGVAEVERIGLRGGLSSSATRGPEDKESDIVDPFSGRPVEGGAACSVMAETAAEAEALSTALVAMGRDRARVFVGSEELGPGVRVLWIACEEGRSRAEWLRGEEKR